MALADGRFLTRADRYDQDATSSMVRVHPDFRVIALSLPVPRFPGFPLDPPLRSRFQARVVSTPPLKERAALLAEKYPQRNDADVASALKLGAALEALGCGGGSNPEGAEPLPLAHRDILFFPDSAAEHVASFASFKDPSAAIASAFPSTLFGLRNAQGEGAYAHAAIIESAFEKFGMSRSNANTCLRVEAVESDVNGTYDVSLGKLSAKRKAAKEPPQVALFRSSCPVRGMFLHLRLGRGAKSYL